MWVHHGILPGPTQDWLFFLHRATRWDVTFERLEEYINRKTRDNDDLKACLRNPQMCSKNIILLPPGSESLIGVERYVFLSGASCL